MSKRGITKEKILTAAEKVFLENGYEASSVKMILNKAGAVTGSFYHFFSSKADLFEAVIDRFLCAYAQKTEEIFNDNALSLDEVIMKAMAEMKSAMMHYERLQKDHQLHWTVSLSLHERTLRSIIPLLAEMIALRISQGRLKSSLDADPMSLAALIVKGSEAIIHADQQISYEHRVRLVKDYVHLLLCENAATLPVFSAELPDAEWQIDELFPLRKGMISFTAFKNQETVFLTASEGCKSFCLDINGHKVPVNMPGEAGTVKADLSSLIRSGINSIEINDIEKGEVRLCIPYPQVIEGTFKDAGLSEEPFRLIGRIITADIDHGFPGAQLAVIKDGMLVCSNAWGNVKTYDENGQTVQSRPVSTDTLYDLASNTKPFSVNYAMQYLVSRGEISLETKVTDILGRQFYEDTVLIEYENREPVNIETLRSWKKKLTLKHLLIHQGGFPPSPQYFNDRYDHASQSSDSDQGNMIYVGTSHDEAAREETLKALCRTPQMYEPGTECEYSDADYMLLCFCLEKITGKRLDEWLDEVFFRPLNLKHICYNPSEHGFKKEDCAATELMGNSRMGRLNFKGVRTHTLQSEVHDPNAYYCMNGVSGHAGLFADASDLAKLAFIMLSGGYGEKKFFSEDVIRLFTAPSGTTAPEYGLGWWVQGDHNWDFYYGSSADPCVFGHQGFTGTLSVIDPKEHMVIVYLTNRIHSPMRMDDETLGKYDGNFYTSGALGFVSEIIQTSLHRECDNEVYTGLIKDMMKNMERKISEEKITDSKHPRCKAYEALKEVLIELEKTKGGTV